jgi:hypothetical protein
MEEWLRGASSGVSIDLRGRSKKSSVMSSGRPSWRGVEAALA